MLCLGGDQCVPSILFQSEFYVDPVFLLLTPLEVRLCP